MSTYNKILLVLIALAYFVSPVDLIPDFLLPVIGWIDDGFLIGLIIYFLRFNRLPGFLNWKSNHSNSGQAHGSTTQGADQEHPGKNSQHREVPRPKKPHEILGIEANATLEEIQAAFRTAAKKYHPDRVAGLGKELQDLANLKFIEIKEAYAWMMKGKR